jgi:MFS transporter, ACS family, D-galactonate transporter
MATVAQSSRLQRIPLTRTQWIFLWLLVASICINYIDRGSIGVAERYLMSDFHLNHERFGVLQSMFFWTYAFCQLLSGWLVDRFNVNRVLAAGFLLWSCAMLGTALATGIGFLVGVRLLMGVGESVAYPSYSKILAGNFREQQRGLANALIDAGCKLGPAIGMLGGVIMALWGWRSFFYIIGGISILWLLPWSIFAPKDQALVREQTGHVPGYMEICTKRAAWGTFLGLFCTNYVWFFMLTWLPSFYRERLHFSQREMSVFGSMPLFVVAASTIASGWLSDRLIANGSSPNKVRKSFCVVGLLASSVMMGAVLADNPNTSLALLCASAFGYGIFSSNLWAITQTCAGPWAAGRWTGAQNFVGNLAGIAAPWLTGYIVDRTGHYYWAFAIVAAFCFGGALCFGALVPRVETVVWREQSV